MAAKKSRAKAAKRKVNPRSLQNLQRGRRRPSSIQHRQIPDPPAAPQIQIPDPPANESRGTSEAISGSVNEQPSSSAIAAFDDAAASVPNSVAGDSGAGSVAAPAAANVSLAPAPASNYRFSEEMVGGYVDGGFNAMAAKFGAQWKLEPWQREALVPTWVPVINRLADKYLQGSENADLWFALLATLSVVAAKSEAVANLIAPPAPAAAKAGTITPAVSVNPALVNRIDKLRSPEAGAV